MITGLPWRHLNLLLLLVSLLLSGCGFHLRTQTIASRELMSLAVVSPDRDFGNILRQTLNEAGIRVTDDASYKINILCADKSTELATATAVTLDKVLAFTVKWRLTTSSGLPLFTPGTLVQKGSYQVSGGNPADNAVFTRGWDNIQKNMATAILDQLGSFSSAELHKLKEQAERQQDLLEKQDTISGSPQHS